MQSPISIFLILAVIYGASCGGSAPHSVGAGAGSGAGSGAGLGTDSGTDPGQFAGKEPDTDPIPEQLRQSLKVVEYTSRNNRRVLYSHHEDDTRPLDLKAKETKTSIGAIYSVDTQSDIVISFDQRALEHIRGNISVRARLQRSPPVELPVQNFTVVSERELKKESVLILNSAKSLFGDDKYNIDFQSSLVNAESAMAMLEHFQKSAPTRTWRLRAVRCRERRKLNTQLKLSESWSKPNSSARMDTTHSETSIKR